MRNGRQLPYFSFLDLIDELRVSSALWSAPSLQDIKGSTDQIVYVDEWDFIDEPTVEVKCECGCWATCGKDWPADNHSDWCPVKKAFGRKL